ncbi:MAG: hypothetical protein K5894_03130 [Lachnospiraceae bacterium]|nr:hypothetical protein [Lachnospiraceae bacterium]
MELAGKEALESEIRSTENDELSSETDEGETIEEETSEEDGVDLYEELAKLDNFTDIRFSKEALR